MTNRLEPCKVLKYIILSYLNVLRTLHRSTLPRIIHQLNNLVGLIVINDGFAKAMTFAELKMTEWILLVWLRPSVDLQLRTHA